MVNSEWFFNLYNYYNLYNVFNQTDTAPERRYSSHTFRYGYLVTT